VQQSIDIPWLSGPQQQTHSSGVQRAAQQQTSRTSLLLSIDWTDGRTDARTDA